MSAVIHLQALGLTEYEARAYTALLALGRAVPARVARQAGIPRPKIYETLERLEGRGLAARVGQNPLEYAPLSAREYLARARRAFDDRLGALDRDLSRLAPDPAPEAVYHLYGEAAIRSLCEDLTLNARYSVYIAGEDALADRLERLTPRGVELHRASLLGLPRIAAEGQRAFLLARDGEAAVIAHFIEEGGGGEAHGVHTHNPVVVHLIEGYVQLAAQRVAGAR
ncbi:MULTISPECIES: TrmB family transcriptional regulator [Deinococcus]|uniref:Transcriptional regulator, TrmB n=1 Tax=Deinococcus geothermalis (strain DSM 11300 / CIP 105573 / AG-3a) TaxID=319795 RepID=Q1IWV5_DEIGD|nr:MULTISPECIES: helix-turn-helix domain-containing protein [Deinococcus]ABF46279.1 transcriptional regulator, TrmB [Deinococcus geothermalis DSM 11300]MBI0444741.1 TrmB family transcriptional regulator [Deinococcus sp. DB0503]